MNEAAWLIESAIQDERGPYYLCVVRLGGILFEWKPGHQHALRFSRRIDAENARDALRYLCPKLFPEINPMPQAREHSWMEQPTHDSFTCKTPNCPACWQESNIEGIR